MCMFAKYNFKTPIFMCEITTFTFTLYKTVRSMLDKKNKNKTYKHIKISNVPVPCYVYKVICYTYGHICCVHFISATAVILLCQRNDKD